VGVDDTGQDGMPLSFFDIVDSVMTRLQTVRCGKWRRIGHTIRRCALMLVLLFIVSKGAPSVGG
jgi:hypothetical protein